MASLPVIRFEHLTIDDGLPLNTINAIHQDKKGFIWVGTQAGLARFDGYFFKNFIQKSNDKYSISNNNIQCIEEDLKGNLIIGTMGGGLNFFNKKTEQFTNFKYQEDNPNSISNDNVISIVHINNNFWIATKEGGLNYFNHNSKKFTRYQFNPNDSNSLSSNNILAMMRDHLGNLWIGTDGGGLNHFNTKTKKFKHYKFKPLQLNNNIITSIYEDKKHNIWIGTQSGGINLYKVAEDKFIYFVNDKTNINSLSNNHVSVIFEDSNNNIWFGTSGGGLNLLSIRTNKFTHYKFNPMHKNSLSGNYVQSIYEDAQGNIWIGTYTGGLNKFNLKTKFFHHYKLPTSKIKNTSTSIKTFYQDKESNLWIGTQDNGLYKLLPNNKIEQYISIDKSMNTISHNRIHAIEEDNNNNLWLATYGKGLNKLNLETQKFSHFYSDEKNKNTLSHNTVQTIIFDMNNNLWIGTRGGGINKFNIQTKEFTHYKFNIEDSNSLSSNDVYIIKEGLSGTLWIGTMGGGLNKFNPKSGEFTYYQFDANNENSISDNIAASLLQTGENTLWVGTSNGLNKLNINTGKFKRYDIRHGLAGNAIYGIQMDDFGMLWVSTNKGLSRLNLNTDKFKNYDETDGLQANAFNGGASLKGINGELFFGGTNGYNRFFPEQITEDLQKPKVVLTDFLLLNKSVSIGKKNNNKFSLNNAIHSTDKLTLSHLENVVSFEFSALNFTNPKKNQYSYKLIGFDQNWISTDYKNRRATYTNLPSGDYVLKIKASNSDGVWNEEGTSMKISVLPPPWRSWWAYSLYSIFFMSLMYIFIRMQRNKILFERNNSQQLEQKVFERTYNIQMLAEIGKEISTKLDLEEIIEDVYLNVNELMDATTFGIGIYNVQNKTIEYKLSMEDNQLYKPYIRDMNDKNQFAVQCIDKKKTIFINNVHDEDEKLTKSLIPTSKHPNIQGEIFEKKLAQSIIYIPLLAKEKVIGLITVQSYEKNAYSQHHLDILHTIATYAVVAIENANAYQKIEEKSVELETEKISTKDALEKIETMLNSIDEGFMIFSADFLIEPHYSQACTVILKNKHLTGLNVAEVLFPIETQDQQTFLKGVNLLLNTNDELKQSFILELLPKKITILNTNIQLSYTRKNNKIILRLINITDKENLQTQLKQEQYNHQKIIYAIQHQNDIVSITSDFRALKLESYFDDNAVNDHTLKNLYLQIHTFKSLFLQISFDKLASQLHELESLFNQYVIKPSSENLLQIKSKLHSFNTYKLINNEIRILIEIFGEEYFTQAREFRLTQSQCEVITNTLKNHSEIIHYQGALDIISNIQKTPISMWFKKHALTAQSLAKKQNKIIEDIEFYGDDLLLDYDKYNAFMQSLIHVFRNAVSHGLETEDERFLSGATGTAKITLTVQPNSSNFIITITDTGKGIDTYKLTDYLIKKNIMSSEKLKDIDKQTLLLKIFEIGLSTKSDITTDHGRGIGLSEVKSQLTKINGHVTLESKLNIGTSFIFTVPF